MATEQLINWCVARGELCVLVETDSLLAAVHDLQDPSRTGPWTISHPVYTPEVSLLNILYVLIRIAKYRFAHGFGILRHTVGITLGQGRQKGDRHAV
jgi:hypothetical protein